MGFSINTNVAAMTANLHLSQNNSALNQSIGSLASANKLGSASNDASSLMIANQLSSGASSFGQTMMNANDSVGMIQIADGAMQGISDNTEKIRTLTLQASNSTLNAGNRAAIQKEIDGLMKSSSQIATSTSYNGIQLLNGSSSGGDSNIQDARMATLFSSPIDVTTQEGAMASLDVIDKGTTKINDIRSSLGASQNQLEATIRNTSVSQINALSAESQLRDVDFAAESANFSKQNMMSQIGSFVQSQANASASNVTRLFQ